MVYGAVEQIKGTAFDHEVHVLEELSPHSSELMWGAVKERLQ